MPSEYSRRELEKKLEKLSETVKYLYSVLNDAENAVYRILEWILLYHNGNKKWEYQERLAEAREKLEKLVDDIVDELIVRELNPDSDIAKYERQYKLDLELAEQTLGVVILRDTRKPVAIFRTKFGVHYFEGEPLTK
jgi:DNA-directed RNA polymerase subunit F